MNTSKHIPLPQDNELPQETVNLLNNLPPFKYSSFACFSPKYP